MNVDRLSLNWSREQQWLCRLLQTPVDGTAREDLSRDTGSLDWPALLETADFHGVTALLAAPSQSMRGAIPAQAVEHIREYLAGVTARNLSRAAQLLDVMDLLRAHGIPALTYKGPVLAQAVTGQLGRLGSADLDILVPLKHVRRVRPVLMAAGYTLPPRRRYFVGSLLYGLYPAAGRDDTLLPPRPELAAVDVQTGFAAWTQGVRLDTRELFDRAVIVTLLGKPVLTLCMDDLLLAVSMHGMMHGWRGLRLVCDVNAVALRVSDWHAVLARATATNLLRVVAVALMVSRDVLGTALPREVAATITANAQARTIADIVLTRLFERAPPPNWDHKEWFLSFQHDRHGRLRAKARELIYEWFLKWPWDEWLGHRRRVPRRDEVSSRLEADGSNQIAMPAHRRNVPIEKLERPDHQRG